MTNVVLIFDMDGVIADSWDSFYPFCRGFFKDIHQPQLGNPTSILRLFEGNFMACLHQAIAPSTLEPKQLQQLANGLSRLMSEAPCFPEVVKTLKALDETHPLYLVTSNFTKAAQLFLDRHQLNCFRSVYGVDLNPNKNPSKVQKIQVIASKYPEQTVFYIGDTLGDLLEAKQAGVGAIAAGWGWHNATTLNRGQPDHYLEHPKDLLPVLRKVTQTEPG